MKVLILLFILLMSCLISASSSQAHFSKWKPILLANSIFNIFPSNHQDKIRLQDRSLPSEIRQDLYNSISTGMSYEEVRAIIGWDGIPIYENEIDTSQGRVREQVYQWDSEDIYDGLYRDWTTNNLGLYWSVTLQFQNGILIEKSSLNLPR